VQYIAETIKDPILIKAAYKATAKGLAVTKNKEALEAFAAQTKILEESDRKEVLEAASVEISSQLNANN
jgi:biotin carboxylase